MSRENVEIARRSFDRLAAMDLDGFLATLADDVEWRPAQALRDYRAHAGVIEALDDWSESWERWELELLDAIDGEGDKVVLVQRTRGKARGSGVEVEQRYYAVCSIRDGKVARMEQIADREAAFGRAGLDEDSATSNQD